MKNTFTRCLTFLIILYSCLVYSAAESIVISEKVNNSEGFEPGFLLFVIIVLIMIVISTAAWIALALLALFILFILLSAGIVSVSVIAGLYKKSFSKAFRVLIILSSAVAGCISLSFIGWLASELFEWENIHIITITAAIAGTLSGILFGYAFCYLLQKAIVYLKEKFKLPNLNLEKKIRY